MSIIIIKNTASYCIYCRVMISEDNKEEFNNSYHINCHEEYLRFNRKRAEKLKNMSREERIRQLRIEMIKELRNCPRNLYLLRNEEE